MAPPPGLLLVVSGPSGVGKTSIVRALRERTGAVFSVSATTRAPTAQDSPGVDYDFVDESTFQRMVDDDAFLEYAQVFGRSWYGTPRAPVDAAIAAGRIVILDIDVQGALQVRERMPGAYMIFIEPPSDPELLRRLRDRGRENEEAIRRRFDEARNEIRLARDSGAYDAFVVNDDLPSAIGAVQRLVAEAVAAGGSRP